MDVTLDRIPDTIGTTTRSAPAEDVEPAPILVHLGCGRLVHPEWINLDIAPKDRAVHRADFRRPLPFEDDSVAAIYHAHVLEHFDRGDAARFLAENVRVLKPGGILRVVVPDLRQLCRNYLAALEAVERGDPGTEALYEWSCLDFLDQMVRRRSCGRMIDFLQGIDLDDHPQIARRLTLEMETALRAARDGRADGAASARKIADISALLPYVKKAAERLRRHGAASLVRLVGGRDLAEAFREGVFRRSGEVHRWMYDSYSLSRLLGEVGLSDIALHGPTDSAIPGFAEYAFDEVDGRVRRPGSLFAEGRKPHPSDS